jgi:hypothetical protein
MPRQQLAQSSQSASQETLSPANSPGSSNQIGSQRLGDLGSSFPAPDLLGPRDLMVRLNIKSSHFYQLQKRGTFRFLEVSRPIGSRRYSRVQVERFLGGESTVKIGRGSRT